MKIKGGALRGSAFFYGNDLKSEIVLESKRIKGVFA